jgi:hypothetical protein
MRKYLCVMMMLFGASIILSGQPNSSYIGIRQSNIQIKGALHGAPIAWAADHVPVKINKQSGEFEVTILVDNLYQAIPNSGFQATGENRGKTLSLRGVIPVNDVLANGNSVIDRKVEVTASFNDLTTRSDFTFTILSIQSGGFSVMAEGNLFHRDLAIANLAEIDDPLHMLLSFVGF